MPRLENLAPVAALDLPTLDRGGHERLLVVAAGRFELPPPGVPTQEPLALAPDQLPPPLEDTYFGEPGLSSLKVEGQSAFTRPGTDITVIGSAWAPAEKPVEQLIVRVGVGPCETRLRVVGDRFWERAWHRTKPSSPRPFVTMPLVYERAFGGTTAGPSRRTEPRNPVGCGLVASSDEAEGCRLPNLEPPDQTLSAIGGGIAPVGLGPIARSWQPRLAFGGTYDQRWVDERAPLWPHDFDERFFCAAPQTMIARPHLSGGEPVRLDGLSPRGTYQFRLPVLKLVASVRTRDRRSCQPMVLDSVQIETEASALTLIWRTSFPMPGGLHLHRLTRVRMLDGWEATHARV